MLVKSVHIQAVYNYNGGGFYRLLFFNLPFKTLYLILIVEL